MARIPYPDAARYERELLLERIKRERGGKLLNLYKMLLHSPPVAEGWLAFFSAVRQSAGALCHRVARAAPPQVDVHPRRRRRCA